MFKETAPHPIFSYLIYLGCAIAFCTIPFGFDTGRNLFYVSSYISFIAVCLHLRYLLKNKRNLILPLLFFCVGMGTIFWMNHFKQPGEYINIYRSYMSTGKLQIATAFILLIALNERLCMQRAFIVVALACGLAVNGYALYQGLRLDIARVELNFDRATVVAYLMTAISLVMMKAILMLRTKYRIPLYVVGFLITFSTLILTGTRAAILVYPVAICLSLLATKDLVTRKHKLQLVASVPVLLLVCGFAFKSQIEQRVADFKTNLQMIDQPEVDNSIISRLTMQVIAIRTGSLAPLGQSAEQRGEEIRAIVAQEPRLYGVTPYINVHLHNELLETYSLKGLWGSLFLLALYIGLFISSFKPYRNALLLGVTFSLFVYGLSDVIFFSTEGTAVFCLAIIASVLSVKKASGTVSMSSSPLLLSFIVPIYNNEDFVIASLSSLYDQIDDDIEVVIIDDGSSDASAALVSQFLAARQHPHSKFITQANGGVAHARNVGLQHVSGRYVAFLDGDDLLSSDYLALLRPLLLTGRDDLIDFNYQKFSGSPPAVPANSEVRYRTYDFEQHGLASLKPLFAHSMWHVWSRIYRRTLLAGETFENGRRYEDVIFTPFQYFKTRQIAHLDHPLYLYRDNDRGITRNIRAKDSEDMLFAMQKMLRFVDAHRGDEPLRQLAALMLANAFSELKAMSKAVYGYYRYPPETLAILRQTAVLCSNSDVPHKKVRQMRFARVDSCLSKIRRWLKKRTG